MKVVALVRTLDEEENIQRFLSRYLEFCDEVIVSDSGSSDDTLKLIEEFNNPKVIIDNCPSDFRIYIGKNVFYTKQPNHINRLFDLAIKRKADWAIYADCDLVPSYQLIYKAREYMEHPDIWQINCLQLHCIGYNEYFPEMTTGHAPWAFRLNNVKPVCDEIDPRHMGGLKGRLEEDDKFVKKPQHPEILLHYFAQTEEEIQKKLDYYSRLHRTTLHPRDRCGPIERIPEEII